MTLRGKYVISGDPLRPNKSDIIIIAVYEIDNTYLDTGEFTKRVREMTSELVVCRGIDR